MRQVVLDTETTGLEPSQGHRIIEIGCCELVNRRATARTFHEYLQPDRDIDAGAEGVHGITTEFLKDKPRFADVAEDFLAFVEGAELIIHNAPFDVGFINAELERLGPTRGRLEDYCRIVDTLILARDLHPGQKNNLDALCRRYGVDNSERDLHGALLDAEILADVYLAMTGGQATLQLEAAQSSAADLRSDEPRRRARRGALRVVRANPEERAAHAERLEAIDRASGGKCLWKRIEDTGMSIEE